jgi:Flp pilus assembly pilin Flp
MNSLIVRATCLLGAALRDRRGVTSLEYGVVAAALIAAVVAGMGLVSGGLNTMFQAIHDSIANVGAPTP